MHIQDAFMPAMKSAKEFTRKGGTFRHRCPNVFRMLSEEAQKHGGDRRRLTIEIESGSLRKQGAGMLEGRYSANLDDMLDPWTSCVVALEKHTGPGFLEYQCPACGVTSSQNEVESGHRMTVVGSDLERIETKD